MLNFDQNIFFSLLRAALWTDADGQPTADRLQEVSDLIRQSLITNHQSSFSWTTLLQAFEDHALLGVVAHAIMSLPIEQQPTEPQCIHIYDHVAALVRTHHRLQTAIVTLFTQMESAGLHPILLKGEGYASLYPKTCVRSCGDIDIYVHPDEFTPARQIIDTFMGQGAQAHDDSLHYEIDKDGLVIELHHKLMGRPIAGVDMKSYNQYIFSLPNDSCYYFEIQSSQIPVFKPLDNLIFSFMHLYKHAYHGAPTFRLFLDTFVLLNQYKDILVVTEIESMCTQFKILESWQEFLGILHYQFDMPESDIPCWNEKQAKKSQGKKLLTYLKVGNFARRYSKGDAISSMPPGLRRKIKHFFYILKDANKTKRIFNPNYTRWHSLKDLLHLTYTQIKEIISQKLKS